MTPYKTEYQKITNLLAATLDEMLKFITKKWVEVRHQSGNLENSQPSKPIVFRTSLLRSNLCDFSDVYIVVKGEVAVAGGSNASKKNRSLAFKSNALFTGCI